MRNEKLTIALGEGSKMFTLRATYKYVDGWGNMYESSYHIQNLSIDPAQAQEKARAYAEKRDMPLMDTSWVFDVNTFDIERKSKEELARLKAEKEKRIARAKEISAKIQMNYHTLMWGYFMAQSCRKFDDLQKVANVAELDTENRVTITGELVHEKEYYSDWGCVLKGIFLLETGQKVFGSVPSMKDQPVNIGDVIQFDAKIEKPKDFDGTFYFFKRPTKAKFISQVKEVA
ncbi:MAG: hypothetical protein CMA07_05700 [Euryarchaeota archaeon]|nr:hypothetical protein [Euryarchaeota archaeon]